MEDHRLDARGLRCPLPVLRARKVLAGLADGARLTVVATDPRAPVDFNAFCRSGGHRLEESKQEGNEIILILRKGGGKDSAADP